jgi:hypothetical protein
MGAGSTVKGILVRVLVRDDGCLASVLVVETENFKYGKEMWSQMLRHIKGKVT